MFLFGCESSKNNSEAEVETEVIEEEPVVLTRQEEILETMSLEEKIGQLFIVRYENLDDEDTADYHLGGITFYARDLKNETPESFKEKIDELQSYVSIPMFMSVDEEGGTVVRVSAYSQYREYEFRSPRSYFAQGGMELVLEREGEKAELLSSLGLNMNLSPVADVTDDPYAYMYDRSLGQDAKTTGEFVVGTVNKAFENGVASVVKHFPGHGNNSDTHKVIAEDERSLEELKNRDLIPFQMAMDQSECAIMIGHTIVDALDSEYPASLSKKVHDYIRNEMGFDGVIMPDALDMTVASLYGDEKCAVLAIEAGNDMLCTTDYKDQYNALINAVKNGEISEERINESVLRILKWKIDLGIID